MGLLDGKVALITGAARGIGRSIALKYASEGADVAFTDLVINEAAEQTVKDIEAFGHKVKAYASNAADFEETQKQIAALEQDVRTVKHAINMFNVTHTLPGFDNMTIDQALIYLPQLSGRVRKLQDMAAALPRERVESYRSTIIDYVIANYDIADAEKAYHAEQEKLNAIQIALDAANSGDTMEIDVSLA